MTSPQIQSAVELGENQFKISDIELNQVRNHGYRVHLKDCRVSLVNKLSKFVVCMTNRAVGYWLDRKESSLIPTLRSKTLPMFQLNASAFIRPDEG